MLTSILLLIASVFIIKMNVAIVLKNRAPFKRHRYLSTDRLSFDVFKHDRVDPTESVVFLHGILGSKKNWRTPCHEFIKKHNSFQAVAIDHRGHGSSPKLPPPNTVSACADDTISLFQSDLRHVQPPSIICAHSFSGKVALMHLKKLIDNNIPHYPKHTWILDSLPGKYNRGVDSAQSQSVGGIISLLSKLPPVFESKDWMTKHLVTQGIPLPIAMWLCMNVVSVSDNSTPSSSGSGGVKSHQFKFSFDMDTIVELFADFCELDMWDFLQSYDGSRGSIQFIRAGKNDAWTPEVLGRFEEVCGASTHIKLHTMAHVGHWLHADDLHGTLDLIAQHSGLTHS